MVHIYEVKSASAFVFPGNGGDHVFLSAIGATRNSGWSNIQLSPRFYITPPDDGLWDIDFTGSPPTGLVLQVITPVSSAATYGKPDWLTGFRLHAEVGSIVVSDIQTTQLHPSIQSDFLKRDASLALIRHTLARYEDSWQPIGHCGGFSIKMKKLVHELVLTVEGPDEEKIRSCIQNSIGVGLIAAIVAVYATGGGALPAAVSAFLSHLTGCLGDGFKAQVDDHSHWVEWCT